LSKASLQAYEYLETMPDHDLPDAIVVSDFTNFLFIKNDGSNEKVEFKLDNLHKNVKLFGFLLGQQSKNIAEEDPVNRKAAESMARLHNQLQEDNYTGRDLEVLLVRLVFCMFADDSDIFDRHSLQLYLEQRTSEDGSDLGPRLLQMFQTLNTPLSERQDSLDEVLYSLPYVNGGLFEETIRTPYFTSSMRKNLLESMELDWSKVSPAIFGSMFQGVMDEKERRNLGAHYTSEKNILRVIKPLFLDELYDEFTRATKAGPRKKYDELKKLQNKLASLKFLDPACGAGNFLVITYRELRRLEHKVLAILAKGNETVDMLATAGEGVGVVKVNVDQMYGIEIEEFPGLIAQTALWLTDHQMDIEFSKQSGTTFKRLPLTKSATIVNDNALTVNWGEVINPKDLNYILGNPPFNGSKFMTSQMRQDLLAVFPTVKGAGVLDFVTAWYAKATSFMSKSPHIETALVSTNSIIQGEQSPVLWKYLIAQGVKINFVHQTFKWSNDAKGNAAVYCTIVGFALFDKVDKRIFEYTDIRGEPIEVAATTINGYGIDAPTTFIEKRRKPLFDVPMMVEGITALDKGGHLTFSEAEKQELIILEPESEKWIKPWITGRSWLNNEKRYCLWLVGIQPTELRSMPNVMERVNHVKKEREASTYSSKFARTPWLFRESSMPEQYIIFPKTSSEFREYVPIGFIKNGITSNTSLILPEATKYHFGILISQMHMAWMRAVAGRLKSDYR